MRHRKANSSCPVRSRMYGGMPSGGGFESNTEWEIGAQRAAEAAHCILGSLGRNVYGKDFEWNKTLQAEQAHIEEENGIIQMVMKEYSRDLYHERLHDGYYEAEDVATTVESVRAAGPRLVETATARLEEWKQEEAPALIHTFARATYRFLIVLGQSMVKATQQYPDGPIQNPYQYRSLKVAAWAIQEAMEATYRDFKREHLIPQPEFEPAPETPRPPLTEEQKQDLKRREDESDVDHIMRLLGADVEPHGKQFTYRGHVYREAGFDGMRTSRRQLQRFSRLRLTSKLWLAKKQRRLWNWSDDIVGSTDQQGNTPQKISWHPLTGEAVLSTDANHFDDIYQYGTEQEQEYLRLYGLQDGRISTVPWNPLFEDLDYRDVKLLQDEIQRACYLVANHFYRVAARVLPKGYDVDVRGCSERY